MNNRYKIVLTVALMVTLLMNPDLLAWGNPVPGRWEKAMQTLPGEKITVYTKDGAKRKYLYVQIEDDFLTCANKYSGNIPIELATIDKIIVSKAGKYAKHGILWGALAGVGISVGYALQRPGSFGGDLTATGQLVLIYAAPAVLGALGGYVAGAAVGAPGETIYISKEKAMEEAGK